MSEEVCADRRVTSTTSDSNVRTLIFSSEVRAVPRSFRGGKTATEMEALHGRTRIFDLLFCVICFPVTLVVFPIIAVIIKFCSPGPVFFLQKRRGKNGKPFVCYKFRTMHSQQKTVPYSSTPDVTQKRDARVYAFGHFLRRTNLDELPQLLNVLKGDMSLVGPRPYMVSECKHWNKVLVNFHKRQQVKPGITGLAQINGYRGGNLDKEHMQTRLRYDLLYIKSYNIKIDISILRKTFLHMLRLDTKGH